MRKLPLKRVGSPLTTNADLNRRAAIRCHEAGMTPEQIAGEWPLVWMCRDGKLSQKYDYEIANGSGRYETNRTITSMSVDEAIKRHQTKANAS
jgi:hypothetical protein